MTRMLPWLIVAGCVAALGFYLTAFTPPGVHPAASLGGVLLMVSSVVIAAFGLEPPSDPDHEEEP